MKRFNVEGYGTVGLDNAVWLRCKNMAEINKLGIAETVYADFSGSGTSTAKVTRILDEGPFYFTAQVGEIRESSQKAPSNFYTYCLPEFFRPTVEAMIQRATVKWQSPSDFGNYEYTQEFLDECMKLDSKTRKEL